MDAPVVMAQPERGRKRIFRGKRGSEREPGLLAKRGTRRQGRGTTRRRSLGSRGRGGGGRGGAVAVDKKATGMRVWGGGGKTRKEARREIEGG